jgi:hypothetical protein
VSKLTKILISLSVAGAVAVPGVAQAQRGTDDPAGHMRHEHQRQHHAQREDRGPASRGNDDGANHR